MVGSFPVILNIQRYAYLKRLCMQQIWWLKSKATMHLIYIPVFVRPYTLIHSLVCDLNRTQVVMAIRGGSCVHFSGISTCGRTPRETVSYPQRPPLPTLYKISLPVYVIVTDKRYIVFLAVSHYSTLSELCLSIQSLYSHKHICFFCLLLICHNNNKNTI